MTHPQTTIINGLPMAAVPPGCCPFPAKYAASWTLHLVVLDGDERTQQSVSGSDARMLNEYAAAAHEHDLAIFAWISNADDQTAAA